MPFTMTQLAPGMTAAIYDEVMEELEPHLRSAPGFLSHSAVATDAGMEVTEVWEEEEQWQAWFDGHVKAHLPPEVPAARRADVHNAFNR